MIKVAVGIYLKDSKVLVVSRKMGGYGFPGGKVDKDERISDALIREVKEETGLDVSAYRLLGTESFDGFRVYYYMMDLENENIYILEDNECFFMDFDEFDVESFHPKNNEFLVLAREMRNKKEMQKA